MTITFSPQAPPLGYASSKTFSPDRVENTFQTILNIFCKNGLDVFLEVRIFWNFQNFWNFNFQNSHTTSQPNFKTLAFDNVLQRFATRVFSFALLRLEPLMAQRFDADFATPFAAGGQRWKQKDAAAFRSRQKIHPGLVSSSKEESFE